MRDSGVTTARRGGLATGEERHAQAAPLRVGVIGLGVISRFYLDGLETAGATTLAAVADLDESRFDGLGPDVTRLRRGEELIESGEVDAVVVTLPNDLHFDMCRAALLAGKHVCCEKPLAPDPAQARELEALAADRGLVLFTAFHRRYNANVVELAGRAADAEWAELEYLERIEEHCGGDSWYLDPARCGGGCIADNGPNAIDTLAFLLGEPRVVEAYVERSAAGVDLRAEILLECGERRTPARVLLDWGYPFGERKQVTVGHAGGTLARADMLDRWPGFKSSLVHEYEAIVEDFAEAIRTGERRGGDGARVAELVADAYGVAVDRGAAGERTSAEPEPEPAVGPDDKTAASGHFVKLLRHSRDNRGMELLPLESRCIRRGEIHEIVTTDQEGAPPGARIDRVAFLGFAEFEEPGVIERGDLVTLDGRPIGSVLGFDECHFPNHYNILIAMPERLTATDAGIAVGAPIEFRPPPA